MREEDLFSKRPKEMLFSQLQKQSQTISNNGFKGVSAQFRWEQSSVIKNMEFRKGYAIPCQLYVLEVGSIVFYKIWN